MRTMVTAADSNARVPVICADMSTITGAEIFNPNFWLGESKGIVQSCWTEYAVLHHCVNQIAGMCAHGESLCLQHIERIQDQWRTSKFDLEKMVIFSVQPDLHIRIEAFFSGLKTLLDVLVQLLSSEKIVGGVVVDGFHRVQDVYGGKVLNALANNALNDRKEAAAKMSALITQHKKLWIDQAILARDQLIHPQKGMYQLMFQLNFAEKGDDLICVKAHPPKIASEPIDQYSQRILKKARAFSSSFLGLLREVVVSNQGMEPTR